jgi:hypothetical protein
LVTEDGPALFDVAELRPRPREGRAEAGLRAALEAASSAAIVGPVDAALAAAALIAARALDDAETLPAHKVPYAVAQLLPPYQRALHGLRLPAEVTPVTETPAEVPAPNGDAAPSWMRDAFGPS